MLGLPIGRLVDRRKRTNIIVIGVSVWSLMTKLCGLVRNFGQLFAARVGVGAGEAALAPAAYSLLSDYFEKKKDLTKALSVYSAALYVGSGIAMLVGGTLVGLVPAITVADAHFEPWQVVFFLVGLPGLLVALLVASLREPQRRGLIENVAMPSIGDLGRFMLGRWKAYAFLMLGSAASGLMWNGVAAWIPTFFIRTFAWTAADVGLWLGLSLLTFGTGGILFGGWASGWIRDRGHVDANLRIGVISAVTALIAGVTAPLMPSASLSMGVFCAFVFAGAMPYGGVAAALQEITPNQMRGQVSAIYLFILNLCAWGLGPLLVATFTDKLFGNSTAIGYSLAITTLIGGSVAAILLSIGCRHYRRAVALTSF